MDPSTLLMAEVAGMIFVAFIATVVLVKRDLARTEAPGAPTASDPSQVATSIPVTLFCPAVGDEALVGLGAVSSGPYRAELTVVECEYLPLGTVACDMACLREAHRA